MWENIADLLVKLSVIIILVSYLRKRTEKVPEKATSYLLKTGLALLVISVLLSLPDILNGVRDGWNAHN